MTMEPSKDYVNKCLQLADEALEDANILWAKRRVRATVNRCYYAMYHAAEAVLYDRGFKPKTHAGLRTMLGEHIINKGILSKERGRSLAQAARLREMSDYEVDAEVDVGRVDKLIGEAKLFIAEIKGTLDQA